MDDVAPSWISARAAATRSEIRRRFADAFRVRPWIYWLDMVGSALLGWSLFAVSALATPWSLVHALATAGAGFSLLRAAPFLHELAHPRSGGLPRLQPAPA